MSIMLSLHSVSHISEATTCQHTEVTWYHTYDWYHITTTTSFIQKWLSLPSLQSTTSTIRKLMGEGAGKHCTLKKKYQNICAKQNFVKKACYREKTTLCLKKCRTIPKENSHHTLSKLGSWYQFWLLMNAWAASDQPYLRHTPLFLRMFELLLPWLYHVVFVWQTHFYVLLLIYKVFSLLYEYCLKTLFVCLHEFFRLPSHSFFHNVFIGRRYLFKLVKIWKLVAHNGLKSSRQTPDWISGASFRAKNH